MIFKRALPLFLVFSLVITGIAGLGTADDTTPPTTTIEIGDPNHGTNPVYVRSQTNFTLTANDDDSGVNYTEYKIDDGDWVNYTEPFYVKRDNYSYGEHTITYRSVNNDGYVEENKTLDIYLESIQPNATNKRHTSGSQNYIQKVDAPLFKDKRHTTSSSPSINKVFSPLSKIKSHTTYSTLYINKVSSPLSVIKSHTTYSSPYVVKVQRWVIVNLSISYDPVSQELTIISTSWCNKCTGELNDTNIKTAKYQIIGTSFSGDLEWKNERWEKILNLSSLTSIEQIVKVEFLDENDHWGYKKAEIKCGVSLECSDNKHVTSQGKSTEYNISVENTGNVTDKINLTIEGVPANWSATIKDDKGKDVDLIILNSLETVELYLNITPPEDATSGETQITVNGTSQGNTSKMDIVITKTIVDAPPIVLDINTSANSVLRNETITFYTNATDVEDDESTLNCEISYRPPFGDWTDLDDETFIPGDHWEADFTPSISTELGDYDFRVRFKDLNNSWSDYTFVSKSVEVMNNIPNTLDLSISKSLLNRTEQITIFVNGSDIEDNEQNLTLIIEYNSTNNTNWRSDNIENINFIIDKWEMTFSPPKDADLGFYNFRARFKDLDNNISDYIYMNDSLEMLNNKPNVIDISFSKNTVLRTQSIVVFVNGTDLEDSEEDLVITLVYNSVNNTNWRTNELTVPVFNIDHWEADFTPSISADLGYYNFRAHFKDNNNSMGEWLEELNNLLVMNNKPQAIEMSFSKTEVLRTDSIKIFFNVSDIEDIENDLILEIEYSSKNNTNWRSTFLSGLTYKENYWEVTFTPSIQADLGLYDFRVRVTDINGTTSNWMIQNDALNVKNNQPNILDINFSKDSIFRNGSIIIYINGTDIEDIERNLLLTIQYVSENNSHWRSAYLTDLIYNFDHWEIMFTPQSSADLGLYNFRARFTDLDGTKSEWIISSNAVNVRNNNPITEDITFSANIIFRTNSINIYLNATDVEDAEGNLKLLVQYKSQNNTNWRSAFLSVPTYKDRHWEAIFTPNVKSDLGFYDVRFKVTDKNSSSSDWLIRNNAINVRNNKPIAVDITFSKQLIFRTQSVMIFVNGTDVEDLEKDMELTVEYTSTNNTNWRKANLTDPEYNTSYWKLTFTPPKTADLGLYDFRVKFEDKNSTESYWLTINNAMKIINNIPIVLDMNYSANTVFRTDSIIIVAVGNDIENVQGDLKPEFQYKLNSDDNWTDLSGSVYNISNNLWEIKLNPTFEDEIGLYDFQVRFIDGNGTKSEWYVKQNRVEVKNNLPIVTITSPLKNERLKYNVKIKGNVTDIEEDIESLEIKIDNNNWTQIPVEENWSYELNLMDYPNGTHTIHVKAYDGIEESVANTTFIVTNPPMIVAIGNDTIEAIQGQNITISGNIKFKDGKPVSNVEIIVKILETDRTWTTISNEVGYFKVEIVAPNEIGAYNISLKASEGEVIGEVIIPMNVTSEIPPPHKVKTIFPFIAGISLLAAVIACGSVLSTERGKYGLFTAMLPLYTRIKKEEVLKHETRESLHFDIMNNPGDNYSSLMKRNNLNNSTFVYHTRVLEREGIIKSWNDGRYKRFYPIGIKIDKEKTELSGIESKIIDNIKNEPGISQSQLAKNMNKSRQVVNYHITKLVEANIIRIEKHGRESKCYVEEEGEKVAQEIKEDNTLKESKPSQEEAMEKVIKEEEREVEEDVLSRDEN